MTTMVRTELDVDVASVPVLREVGLQVWLLDADLQMIYSFSYSYSEFDYSVYSVYALEAWLPLCKDLF